MFSTPFTCCSIGAATVSATVCELAPGYDAETSTVGGVISGYCATGNVQTATPPASVMTMDSTEAKIGRSMKKRENMGIRGQGPGVTGRGQRSEVRGQRSEVRGQNSRQRSAVTALTSCYLVLAPEGRRLLARGASPWC